MKNKYSNIISISLIFILTIFIFIAIKSYNLETTKQNLKKDLIELSDIKYGMFNVDKWKEKIAIIISKKIKELKITGENREKARMKIIAFLHKTIITFEKDYKIENRRKSWFGISYKNIGADVFSVFDRFREQIPKITDDILDFLEKKENRDKIKDYILLQLDKYTDNTFQKMDYSDLNIILNKYEVNNELDCKAKLSKEIKLIESKIEMINYYFIFLLFILFLIIIFNKFHSKLNIIFYILIAFIFLVLGLLLPMIDIDARISLMEFKLMGERISFNNQVLYYKSKSILEMSKIMLSQEKIKIILVGVLVIIFSVLFPISKLLSSLLIQFKKGIVKNKIVNFMVFKSGKWSMADVMVIAIFMSYIGFSGIISGQLSQLEKASNKLNILTTNNSELQNGFFFFVVFVLISISISQIILNNIDKKPAENSV